MPCRFIPSFFLMLVAVWATAAPAARTGEASVRETRDGLPCFTIAEREEQSGDAPDFESIIVYDASKRPRARMWTMSMPPTRTFALLFSMCIPYAGRVQSLPQTKAATLVAGKLYEVAIDVRAGYGRAAPNRPRRYSARFCLARQRDGAVTVRHIGTLIPEGRNLYDCIAPR